MMVVVNDRNVLRCQSKKNQPLCVGPLEMLLVQEVTQLEKKEATTHCPGRGSDG